ncbi:hypothetical protein EIN_468790 [Entamoeba invadens IP1]|uniref:Uncharacterized protein n=1 Tax=Entamoeba invadens IP1 TaxID=370355 RepID=A0A0A1TUJ3_ENTIV|nr:hypothetical protein EIN_468790 [Entamoeba invadens IP1]ELP83715.1 hypothetical protein EIN_468790 [Entamoeba invadens IP1]|eukprot:XP_004183061.1 hypothetical protein EIN_468790 [Entamoeba invadens IP1]
MEEDFPTKRKCEDYVPLQKQIITSQGIICVPPRQTQLVEPQTLFFNKKHAEKVTPRDEKLFHVFDYREEFQKTLTRDMQTVKFQKFLNETKTLKTSTLQNSEKVVKINMTYNHQNVYIQPYVVFMMSVFKRGDEAVWSEKKEAWFYVSEYGEIVLKNAFIEGSTFFSSLKCVAKIINDVHLYINFLVRNAETHVKCLFSVC